MKLNIVAAAYAAWLAGVEIAFFIAGGADVQSLEMVILLGIAPAALQIALLGFSPYGLVKPARAALWFLLIVLMGYLSSSTASSLTYFVELVFVFTLAMVVSSSPEPTLVRKMASFYTVPAAILLLFVVATGEHVYGRLNANGIHPNWWGLMGAALAVTGLAHRSKPLSLASFLIGFYVAYDASSRNSMLALLVGVLVVIGLSVMSLRGSRLVTTVLITAIALVCVTVFLSGVSDTVASAVNDAFKLNDPHRGVGSGFTGRTIAWDEALKLWLKSPLFGVGSHQHELFMPYGGEAHDTYLAALVETGVFGALWYVWFILASLAAALNIRDVPSRNVIVGTIITYAVIGLFEARGINGGNPLSLYFQICCFFALSQVSVRQAVRSMPTGMALPVRVL